MIKCVVKLSRPKSSDSKDGAHRCVVNCFLTFSIEHMEGANKSYASCVTDGRFEIFSQANPSKRVIISLLVVICIYINPDNRDWCKKLPFINQTLYKQRTFRWGLLLLYSLWINRGNPWKYLCSFTTAECLARSDLIPCPQVNLAILRAETQRRILQAILEKGYKLQSRVREFCTYFCCSLLLWSSIHAVSGFNKNMLQFHYHHMHKHFNCEILCISSNAV